MKPYYRLSLVLWLCIWLLLMFDGLGFAFGVTLIFLFDWISRLRDRGEAIVEANRRAAFDLPQRDLKGSQGRLR